jgi:hypothetical protein
MTSMKLRLVPPAHAWSAPPPQAHAESARIYLRSAEGRFRRLGAEEWKAFRRGARRLAPIIEGAAHVAVLPDPLTLAAVPWAGLFALVPAHDDGTADEAVRESMSDAGVPLSNVIAACEWTPTTVDRDSLAQLTAEVCGGPSADEGVHRVQLQDLHRLRDEAAETLKRIARDEGETSEFYRKCQELWRQREEDAYYSLLSADLQNAAVSLQRGIDALFHGHEAFKNDGLALDEIVKLMATC